MLPIQGLYFCGVLDKETEYWVEDEKVGEVRQ